MSIAYWCVLAAAILPYLTISVAKARGGTYDNANPRALDAYKGLASRAHGAHENGFEVFPFFAVAVLIASGGAAEASVPLLDILALTWIALRIGYIGAYLGNRPTLRSTVWSLGLLVAIAIFTMPAWHG